MRRYFCTLFDRNYLIKGVSMIKSLIKHCHDVEIYVLCMDSETKEILTGFDFNQVHLILLSDIENQELLSVKPGRSAAEYCWTLSAFFSWYIMSKFHNVDMLTYLDADLLFYSNVEPLFDEINTASIAIIEHRFSEKLIHLEAYGRFNVEWVSFRRDSAGLACLEKWKNQCIEWCFARLEDGRMGDQKYLDSWPTIYADKLCILQHYGAGIAPWNYANYKIAKNNNQIFINDVPLVFYHFHQFQILKNNKFHWMSKAYSENEIMPDLIYLQYENEIKNALYEINKIRPGFRFGIRSVGIVTLRHIIQRFVGLRLKNFIRKIGIQIW